MGKLVYFEPSGVLVAKTRESIIPALIEVIVEVLHQNNGSSEYLILPKRWNHH